MELTHSNPSLPLQEPLHNAWMEVIPLVCIGKVLAHIMAESRLGIKTMVKSKRDESSGIKLRHRATSRQTEN
jgi:hypothetical protein